MSGKLPRFEREDLPFLCSTKLISLFFFAFSQASDLKRREQVAAHLRQSSMLTPEELEPLYITMSDFLVALPNVQPSAKREGFVTIPDVSWSDIGALDHVRSELQMAIVNAIRHPEA